MAANNRSTAIGFAVALAALWPTVLPAAPLQWREYPAKASYLVRFAAFVQWPVETFANATSPLVICVLGQDPFGPSLDKAVAGQVINGRPVVARRLAKADSTSACQIIYIGPASEQSVAQLTALLAEEPVLIVTDAAQGPERGHIHFVRAATRVRFYIDDGAAKRAGLSISSRLLTLALTAKAGG